MSQLLTPVLVLGLMGFVFAILLGHASQVFAVEVHETVVKVRKALPGANCGACGYPGCDGFAKAVAEGVAPVDGCPVGGPPVAEKVANIMGVDAGDTKRMVAVVHCIGNKNHTRNLYEYQGKNDCRTVCSLGVNKSCQYGCIGCGTCVEQCEYGALSMKDGIAVIDEDKCVACKKCIKVCPQNIIKLLPYDRKTNIFCSSYDFGKTARQACDVGCIGCGLCSKLAPGEFEMDGKLAKVRYDNPDFDMEKAIKAAEKCPAKCIKIDQDQEVEITA